MEYIVLIPAYEPDNKLINLVKKETSNSFMVIDEIQKVKWDVLPIVDKRMW